MWDHPVMNPEDPERYIRNLERGASQPPGATPPPPLPAPPPSFGTRFTGQFGGPVGGPYSGGSYGSGFGDLGVSRRRGPRMAVVADVAVQPEQPEGLGTFQIR